MIQFFGGRGCTVVGIDITMEMLEAAKNYGLPQDAVLARFDGLSIPLKDNSVDIVWISGVLKYTLFPPGSPCLHGIAQMESSYNKRFGPTCGEIAREMYR